MKLAVLKEDETERQVMGTLYRYLRDNGIPNEKMDWPQSNTMYIGGHPGDSPKRAYIFATIRAGNISIGYYGPQPHYLEGKFSLYDPDSFPKALEFIKARKDIIP